MVQMRLGFMLLLLLVVVAVVLVSSRPLMLQLIEQTVRM
jgi:hypothetical protein